MLTLRLSKIHAKEHQVSVALRFATVVHAKKHAYANMCEIHAPVRFAENRISFFGAYLLSFK